MGKRNVKWSVQNKSSRTMLSTTKYRNALKFYNSHPRAVLIQKSVNGVSAGIKQPNIPRKITVKGKEYTRAYLGGHTKDYAQKLVKGFKKQGNDAFARKTAHGWQVFLHMR